MLALSVITLESSQAFGQRFTRRNEPPGFLDGLSVFGFDSGAASVNVHAMQIPLLDKVDQLRQ
eukprot:8716716-Karenia_brevis.AAC.1